MVCTEGNPALAGSASTACLGPRVRRVTHPQARFGLATRPPLVPLSRHPALAALVAALPSGSDLAFLRAASAASVLRGGYTNALYLVKVRGFTNTPYLVKMRGFTNASLPRQGALGCALPWDKRQGR